MESDGEPCESDVAQSLLQSPAGQPTKGWKERRRRTVAVFLLLKFGEGFEFTTLYTTLWSYVNKCLHHSEPYFSYGLISSGFFVGPILLGGLVSRWLDKSRAMKLSMIVVTLVVSAGCVVYTINTSPYIPALGMVMIGVKFVLEIAKNSELIRVYEKDEIQQVYLYSLILYGMGEATGPVVVKLLDKVHFKIGALQICYGNISGVILLVFNIFKLLAITFFTNDLSKEFDFKTKKQYASGPNSFSSSLKKSFTPDAIFLLLQQLYAGFFVSFLCRTFPLAVETLHYNDFILDVCFFVASISTMIISIVAARMKLSQKGVYVCGLSCLIAILLIHFALVLLPLGFNKYFNSVLLSVLVVGYGFCWVTDQTFMVVTLGKMFPSSVQTSIEGIRSMVQYSGSLLASFFSAYMYREFNYVLMASIPFVSLLLVVMVLRRNVFINPRVREFTDSEKK